MIERPFFIIGSERSGTTLLRLMLDHHPAIACHFEFEHAVERIYERRFPQIEDYREWLHSVRSFIDSGVELDPSLDFPRLVDSFLVQKRDRDEKQLVGATVHRHFDRLRYVWPDARFIHIIRDGRDVSRSCVSMGWAGNAWGGADRWLTAERLWDRVQSELPPSDYHEVRYEGLVQDPRGILTKVCKFIGVAFDEQMFDYAQTSTYSLPDPNLTYQWKVNSSNEEIRVTEAKIREMLVRRGYELSGLPILEIDEKLARLLEKEDRRERRRFRINRYGFMLLAFENLTRRLPLRPFHLYLGGRMDQIDRKYIK